MAKRCGSLCWTAQEAKCECICSGAMHGKASEGRRQVIKALCGFLPKTERDMEHVRTVVAYKILRSADGAKIQRALETGDLRRLGC